MRRTATLATIGLLADRRRRVLRRGAPRRPAPPPRADGVHGAQRGRASAASVAPQPSARCVPPRRTCRSRPPARSRSGPTTRPIPPYFAADRRRQRRPRRGSSATRPTARASRAPSRYALADDSSASPPDQVSLDRTCPFDNSYEPGAKTSTSTSTRSRTARSAPQAVDLSDGYYFVNQAVVALAANPRRQGDHDRGLADYRFGAQVGTTSLQDDHRHHQADRPRPSVYDTNDAAITALKAKQIDAHRRRPADRLLHDRRAARGKGTVVGQFKLPDRRRRRALQRRPRQGQPVHVVRQRRDRGPHRRRHAWPPSPRSGCPTRRRRRSSRRSRRIHAAMIDREARR